MAGDLPPAQRLAQSRTAATDSGAPRHLCLFKRESTTAQSGPRQQHRSTTGNSCKGVSAKTTGLCPKLRPLFVSNESKMANLLTYAAKHAQVGG